MQKVYSLVFLLFSLLAAVAGVALLLNPQWLFPQLSDGAEVVALQAGFGLLLAAGVNLFCLLRADSRTILHPLLLLHLTGVTVSVASNPAAAWWIWLPLAVYLLPLLSLLPASLSRLPLQAGQLQGEVKWFNPNKGYGFIMVNDGREVFVHFRALREGERKSLRQGQLVRFSLRHSERGEQAADVQILD